MTNWSTAEAGQAGKLVRRNSWFINVKLNARTVGFAMGLRIWVVLANKTSSALVALSSHNGCKAFACLDYHTDLCQQDKRL
jgi:hypothetical protein